MMSPLHIQQSPQSNGAKCIEFSFYYVLMSTRWTNRYKLSLQNINLCRNKYGLVFNAFGTAHMNEFRLFITSSFFYINYHDNTLLINKDIQMFTFIKYI